MDRMLRDWRWGLALLVALFVVVGPSAGWAATSCNWAGGDILPYTTMCNLGIGMDTPPTQKLHLYGATSVVERFDTGTGNANNRNWAISNGDTVGGLSFQVSPAAGADPVGTANTKLMIDRNGNVGVGTAAPTSTLSVVSPTTTVYSMKVSQPRTLMLSQYTNTSAANTSNQAGFDYRLNTDSAERTSSRLLSGFSNISDASRTSYIAFANNDNGAFVETARFVGRNLGIGTTAPTAKLHVVGDALVSGKVTATNVIGATYGQDVAEWVPTKSALLPGTVVIIDPNERNQVLPAAKPYDTRVAGVVSTQPGVLLGVGGEDKARIAQLGRVPVKVDASFGPIAVGDLLVTSPTPGYAMRSTPVDLGGVPIHRPGTLVGKALEPLADGQGEILVLLTLQ